MGDHPTRKLRDEHRLIARVVDALERHLEREGGPETGTLRRFVEFFSLFTDACHHAKEEDILFHALVEEGFPLHQGPIAAMLREHEEGRALVRRMGDAVDRMPTGAAAGPAARRELERAARDYIGLLRGHIGKEDHGLFETADHALDGSACQRVCDAYEEVACRRFAGRSAEELERLGEELIARTG